MYLPKENGVLERHGSASDIPSKFWRRANTVLEAVSRGRGISNSGSRDVFIVSQDPFWLNNFVFDLWLFGATVEEALQIRLEPLVKSVIETGNRPAAGGSVVADDVLQDDESFNNWSKTLPSLHVMYQVPPRTDADRDSSDASNVFDANERLEEDLQTAVALHHWNTILKKQKLLLQIDTAHNYHVFDLLVNSLSRPESFLCFCPLQIRLRERRVIVKRYYQLSEAVIKEIVTRGKVITTRKHRSQIRAMVGRTGERLVSVRRQVDNIHRIYGRLRASPISSVWSPEAGQQEEDGEGVPQSGGMRDAEQGGPVWLDWCFGKHLSRLYYRISFILHHRIDVLAKKRTPLSFPQINSVVGYVLEAHFSSTDCLDIPSTVVDISRALAVTFKKSKFFDEWRNRVWNAGASETGGHHTQAARFGRNLEILRMAVKLRTVLSLFTVCASSKELSKLFLYLFDLLDRVKLEDQCVEFINACETALVRQLPSLTSAPLGLYMMNLTDGKQYCVSRNMKDVKSSSESDARLSRRTVKDDGIDRRYDALQFVRRSARFARLAIRCLAASGSSQPSADAGRRDAS